MAADFGKNPFLCDEGRIREDRRKKGWEEEMGRKEEKRSVSFQRHLLVVLSFFIIPMLFFLFLYNYYSVQTLNNEVAQIGDNMIELYRSKTERDLYSLNMTIAEYWANDYDHVNMVNQVDPLTRHLSGYEIGVKYRSLLSTNHFLEGIAIISMKNQLQRFYFKERLSALAQHKEMKNLAGEWLMQPAKYIEKGWQPVWICGDGMLMRMLGRLYHFICQSRGDDLGAARKQTGGRGGFAVFYLGGRAFAYRNRMERGFWFSPLGKGIFIRWYGSDLYAP